MSAQDLFLRELSLALIRPTDVRQPFGLQPNAKIITDLRVSFEIEKNLGKEPNTCEISVYNLSSDSISDLVKPLHIQIDAGYASGTSRLFSGDLVFTESRKDGDTWETRMELADGLRAYKHARTSRSYGPGTTVQTAVADVAKSMGFSVPPTLGLEKTFNTGVVLEGSSRDELDRLLRPLGYGWSQQDGTLQILKKGRYTSVDAIVINQSTGMLGIPEFGTPERPRDKPILTVKTLLDPRLKPGGRVFLTSSRVSGLFVIQRVQHSGDTRGENWYSSIEAISV